MIQTCPHCGYDIEHGLKDGLANCLHCNQVFDSSDYNKLLSAAWQIRKKNVTLEHVRWMIEDEDLSILVHTFVNDHEYTHAEFVKALKKFGVAHKSYIDYSK
jgi:hypothetical protein